MKYGEWGWFCVKCNKFKVGLWRNKSGQPSCIIHGGNLVWNKNLKGREPKPVKMVVRWCFTYGSKLLGIYISYGVSRRQARHHRKGLRSAGYKIGPITKLELPEPRK